MKNENESLIEKIKSKYIVQNIGLYIKDENIFLKLFFYSKHLQEKLNVNLFYFQENFINKRVKWKDYLYFDKDENYEFNNNYLTQKLNEDMSEFNTDKETMSKIILNYYQKIINNIDKNNINIYEDFECIDFSSPFFELISNTEYFEKYFSIIIPMDLINEYNLKKFYISNIKNLNALKSKYSSLSLYLEDINDIIRVKNLKINFKQIKQLDIFQKVDNIENINKLNKNLFSVINIANNLVYLSLNIFNLQKDFINGFRKNTLVNKKSFELINNCNSLKYLKLYYLEFSETFVLKLTSLHKIYLYHCKNISLDKNSFLILKSIILDLTWLDENKLLGFPELEELLLGIEYNKRKEMIELDYFPKLKFFKGFIKEFLLLESPLLEEVNLAHANSFLYINQAFEKIFTLKFLKHISLNFMELNDDFMQKIKGENKSVTEMNLVIHNSKCPKLDNLFNKFPNLSELFIELHYYFDDVNPLKEIYEFIEKPECKINKIHIIMNKQQDFKLYLKSYKDLELISFTILENPSLDIKNMFPIFNNKCDIIFESLKSFSVKIPYSINLEVIENIFNNIINMPNLTDFSLSFSFNKNNITSLSYRELIRKVLTMKYIKTINIKMLYYDNGNYTKKELKKLYSDINFNKFYEVNIQDISKDEPIQKGSYLSKEEKENNACILY